MLRSLSLALALLGLAVAPITPVIAAPRHHHVRQRHTRKDTRDMKGGDYWRRQIDEAIRLRDKTVLICSQESLTRPAVIEELLEAIALQDKTGVMKLFPIRLDDFIFSEEMEQIGKEQMATGEWPKNWLAKVRAFHIPDFSEWKDHQKYQQAFQALLRDLKAEPVANATAPA